MSPAAPTPSHPTGLAAALAVVRLVMALLESLFAGVGDLPADHPDRRLHARLMAVLARAEARILADLAAVATLRHRARTMARAKRLARAAAVPAAAPVHAGPITAPAWLSAPFLRSVRAPPPRRSSRQMDRIGGPIRIPFLFRYSNILRKHTR